MSIESSRTNTFIIIVTYNGTPWIRECLNSCAKYPVIVVDNVSTDETVHWITSEYPAVTLLEESKNLGFGQANNKGISLALKKGARQVFLLNQDAYLQAGCIEQLVKVQQKFPMYGILSPIHLNGKGEGLDKAFVGYVSPEHTGFLSDFVLSKAIQPLYEVPFVNAAGWLIAVSTLHKVGGFDPLFFMYGEDDNLCQRMHYHGFKIGVVPHAFLRHDREDRAEPDLKKFSTAFYEGKRKLFLSKLADITHDQFEEWYRQHLNLRKKKYWLSLWNLKFALAAQMKKERKLLEQTYQDVLESRKLNQEGGPNYLI